MANDIITHLDDEAVQGLTLNQAVEKMRGPVNTKIKLRVMRKGQDKPVEISITRDVIRVRAVRAYLDGFSAGDFAGAATRVVTQPRWEGKVMTGADYFLEHAVPNFFFHTTHAYAILRHVGVPLGKRHYLGALSLRAP